VQVATLGGQNLSILSPAYPYGSIHVLWTYFSCFQIRFIYVVVCVFFLADSKERDVWHNDQDRFLLAGSLLVVAKIQVSSHRQGKSQSGHPIHKETYVKYT